MESGGMRFKEYVASKQRELHQAVARRVVERGLKRLMSLVHSSFRRLLSNHQTWPIAAALLSRTYRSVSCAKNLSYSDQKKLRIRHKALISAAGSGRRIERTAREEFSNALHNILKQRRLHGLIDRGDEYVSVKELVRDSTLASKMYAHSNNVFVVELPTFSNVILLRSPKGGERRY
jgi:hypothetical protein